MKHEKGCWSGAVEAITCSMEPAYQAEWDKEEECLECKVIRGDLILNPDGITYRERPPTVTQKTKSFFKRIFLDDLQN